MTHVIFIRFAIVIAVGLSCMPEASAYPWYQQTSGSDRCVQCHVAPAGGGALSAWGRSEVGDTLARGGDGAFLHGLVSLPEWLDLGGDVRLAGLVNDTGNANGAELAAFPMQAELGAHVAVGDVHAVGSVGILGAVRAGPPPMTGISEPVTLPWLISREHYLMWRPGDEGAYVRLGKFFTPFGLRLPDHTTYVRRYLGYNLLEEPYAFSAGYVALPWELHVAVFVSDRLRWAPREEIGASVMYERRSGPMVLIGSARATRGDDQSKETGSLAAKLWSESLSLLWMAEIDGGWHHLPGAGRPQLAGYFGPVWFPTRGLSIATAYEYYDEDLRSGSNTRHAADVWCSFMPSAHFELALAARYQWIGSAGRAASAILQLHYFL